MSAHPVCPPRPGAVRLAMLLGFIPCVAAFAQLPQPILNHVFPAGAAPGVTNEITVGAADLDEPGALIFGDPRIVGRPKPGAASVYQVIVPTNVPSVWSIFG